VSRRVLRRKVDRVLKKETLPIPRFVCIAVEDELRGTMYGDLALESLLQGEIVRSFAEVIPCSA